mgnify:CR=1 FL=1
MVDVVPALNEAITHSFETNMIADRRLNRITKRIRDGTANLVDAHRYSQYTGENLSKALLKNLTADTLPDSTLYYNIANRTVTPALQNCHKIVNDVAKQCQGIVDEAAELFGHLLIFDEVLESIADSYEDASLGRDVVCLRQTGVLGPRTAFQVLP